MRQRTVTQCIEFVPNNAVKLIIVRGHYGRCGVEAALENHEHGHIDNWLRHIKDVVRFHKSELAGAFSRRGIRFTV